MRTIVTLLFTLAFACSGHAQDFGPVKSIAEQYWSAIRSKNPERIYALFDPAVFEGLSPEEVAAIKEKWTPNYEMLATKEGDSYEVEARRWDSGEAPAAPKGWHWPVKPQFQFQIQTFRHKGDARESLFVISDLAVERDGKIMIVRPVPNPETAKELVEKKKD